MNKIARSEFKCGGERVLRVSWPRLYVRSIGNFNACDVTPGLQVSVLNQYSRKSILIYEKQIT